MKENREFARANSEHRTRKFFSLPTSEALSKRIASGLPPFLPLLLPHSFNLSQQRLYLLLLNRAPLYTLSHRLVPNLNISNVFFFKKTTRSSLHISTHN